MSLALISLLSNNLFAHGMNSYGPHGGYIKMPGAFHTELVNKGSQLNIYLLDMAFKTNMTNNSTVKIKYIGNKELKYQCIKTLDHFNCKKPSNLLSNYKKIIITTIKDNKSTDAEYDLPLKLK
jgi:hypothetical protein